MTSGDWSISENDAVVASYFAMLSDELSARAYNKAAQNRALQDQTGPSAVDRIARTAGGTCVSDSHGVSSELSMTDHPLRFRNSTMTPWPDRSG
jgi:hypothetical protein